ncbi:protein-tyrosine phosphatase family protein [Desulfospira joergensenii]|uniref:protein-tyrosine phosphatase family protein n=1 Tax=Desulfospira joergensenii TaxID=53329 RepID=UPI0003B52D95|nr:dual specificity protein phosphatase [Desulfospira joergensenii]
MTDYLPTWITDSLAVGHAPMSYAQLDTIKKKGIDAIVNLCAEFSDLHELESSSGFEVYYLPIWDEDVPGEEDMEKALAWLDEAIYLGKKVLIHCRHGIGRTGTFVTAYLIRKGLGMKGAAKILKASRANPSNYGQWKLVKKYHKKSGILRIREPSLEVKNRVDLSRFFSDYESLVSKIDREAETHDTKGKTPCGQGGHSCCSEPFEIQFMEVVYLYFQMGRRFTSARREETISRAARALKNKSSACPFNRGTGCEISEFRPVRCRIHGVKDFMADRMEIEDMLFELSRAVFLAFSGKFLTNDQFRFTVAETVSGKFVQAYFNHMIAAGRNQ